MTIFAVPPTWEFLATIIHLPSPPAFMPSLSEIGDFSFMIPVGFLIDTLLVISTFS